MSKTLDAYQGGKFQGGKRGRGSPHKVAFLAAVPTSQWGDAALMCLSPRPFTSDSILAFAPQSLAARATLVSDDLGCLKVIQGTGTLHEPHINGGGRANAKRPSFHIVYTALGNLKTSLSGTFLALDSMNYAHRALDLV